MYYEKYGGYEVLIEPSSLGNISMIYTERFTTYSLYKNNKNNNEILDKLYKNIFSDPIAIAKYDYEIPYSQEYFIRCINYWDSFQKNNNYFGNFVVIKKDSDEDIVGHQFLTNICKFGDTT